MKLILRRLISSLTTSPWLLLSVLAYWIILFLLGGLKSDHFIVCSIALILFYTNDRTKHFLSLFYPIILSGILYDSMRYYADFLRGAIYVAPPYEFDSFFFSIPHKISALRLTPNAWWQENTLPFFDFICGLAYLIFIFEYIGITVFLYFQKKFLLAKISAWTFFTVNLFGYITYYLYAAAPPWYVALYGMGAADLATPANPAGASRFDTLLGTNFFIGMYGKAADVFGAVPSLHVSYPLVALILCWQIKKLRAFSIFFYILMCFSAVYLNHHYILDILLGSLYAITTYIGIHWYFTKNILSTERAD